MSSIYAEDTIIIANNILYLSIIIPILKKVQWNIEAKRLILLVPAIIGIPLIFYENFYLNILVDAILGIFLAYTLYQWYSEEDVKFRNVSVGLGLASIGLIKLSGIGIILAIVLIIIGDITRKKEDIKNNLISIMVIVVIVISLILMWNIRIMQNNSIRNWNMNSINIESIKDVIIGNISKEKQGIRKLYEQSIISREKITERNLTVITTTLLLLAINIYIYNKIKQKNKYRYFSICLCILEIIYLIYMMFIYLFLFNTEEAMAMSSFERYIGTIFLGMLLFHIMVANGEIEKIEIKSEIIFLCIMIAFLPMNTIQERYIDKEQYKLIESSKRKRYIGILKYKEEMTSIDKIGYIDMTVFESRYSLQIAKYQMLPIKVETIINIDNIEEEIKKENYTYIYIQKITETEKEILGIELKDETMYKIQKEEGKIQLIECKE